MRFVVVVVGLCVSACTSNSGTTVRDLPLNLQPVGSLLDGCEHSPEPDGAIVARCDGDVLLRVRDVEVEPGSAPRYFGDGVDLANANAGRMVWDTVALPTSVDKGVVDRGKVQAVADDAVVVLLFGAARHHADDEHLQKEVSCQAPPSASSRCEQMLVAFLDLPVATRKKAPVAAAAGASHGSIHGRAISFPTTCSVVEQAEDHGRYTCADEAKLYWMITEEMDEAAAQADGAFQMLADGEDRVPTPCALLDADAQCESTAGTIVGLGYIQTKAIVVVCAAPDPLNHSLCKSAFRRKP
ncbi:MAG: hypothetical protein Q8O67_30325 [Deltaproteobacteria bacterium]|nr:hypothetical protein [Deltaproteobacteria bacterium]